MAGVDTAVIVGAALFIAALAVGIVFAVRAAIARAARIRAEYLAIAARQGWEFIATDAYDRPGRYSGFTPFGKGDKRRAENVLSGPYQGTTVDLFTYRYEVTTSNGKTTQTTVYRNRIVAMQMPVAAPNLTLSKETLGKKIFDALGGEDIDFEWDEFSRRFWVKCDDRKFAYDAIDARMMEWLMAQADAGVDWQWRGRTLMVTKVGRFSPEECLPALAFAQGFRERLPRVLLEKHKAMA
ncbi:MAG: hypothetical protein ABR562_09190 [Thermoplasmatota archaeon]